jgi:putative PIN family toxin of toxin-antitoxin system
VLRAVVDTNVWVSALVNPGGHPAEVLRRLIRREFTLLLSEPLVTELNEVLARPRLGHRFGVTPAKVDTLLALLGAHAERVPVTGSVQLCRDPDDDMVIETAVNGSADVLVSRDGDFKGVEEVAIWLRGNGVDVVSVRRFLEILDHTPPESP